jgi:hypothetical protein
MTRILKATAAVALPLVLVTAARSRGPRSSMAAISRPAAGGIEAEPGRARRAEGPARDGRPVDRRPAGTGRAAGRGLRPGSRWRRRHGRARRRRHSHRLQRPARHGPARDMPGATAPAGPPRPQGEQGDTGATGDTRPAGSAGPQAPKGQGRHRAEGRQGHDQPAETARHVRRGHARASDELTIPNGGTDRGDGEPPRGSVARGGGYVITPGEGRQ